MKKPTNEKLKFAMTGFLGGLANGFFGSGGGLFLVPLFTHLSKMSERKAFATSIAVILPLSTLSTIIYFSKDALDISAAMPYLIGGGLGGIIAGRTFKKIPLNFLRRCFGILIIYGGIRAIFNR